MVPTGYKVVTRLDRTAHGGGLLIVSRDELLCDVINMKKHNTVEEAKLVAMKHEGITHILGYTNKSSKAHVLIATLTDYMMDHPGEPILLYGDFNVHNVEWICSDKTDKGGVLAQEFSELFGLTQLVGFTTRGANTLDLILTDVEATATKTMPCGTSDHAAIEVVFATKKKIAEAEERPMRLMWRSAPWDHIRGYLKRRFAG